MKAILFTISILLLGFSRTYPEKEMTSKTYYYYLEISKEKQNSDYSYDIIFSEVKSANCDWDNTSKYGYGRTVLNHIAIAFDDWFQAHYDNPYGYKTGYESFGNKKLYTSRTEAESDRNKAVAYYKNSSNIKYNIKHDNRYSYICE